MKTTMKSLIFGFLAMFLAFSITSCGDESNDPTPAAPATSSLAAVNKALVGVTLTFLKAEVTDGTDPVQTITKCSDILVKYKNSVVDMTLKFLSATDVQLTNNCGTANNVFIYKWKLSGDDTNLTLLIDQATDDFESPVVNATILVVDILDANKNLKSEMKTKFNVIVSPVKSWTYSPTMYFKKN